MIPSFEVLPLAVHDATNSINMLDWSDPGMAAELARREIWRASARLDNLIDQIKLTDSRAELHGIIDDALAPLVSLQQSLKEPKV